MPPEPPARTEVARVPAPPPPEEYVMPLYIILEVAPDIPTAPAEPAAVVAATVFVIV